MQVVTPEELASALDRITNVFETGLATIAAKTSESQQRYFTRAEAAEYLRISLASLDRLTATGEIRRAKLGEAPKATVLYRREDLDHFVEGKLQCDKEQAAILARRISP